MKKYNRLAVLTHAGDNFEGSNYILAYLVKEWQAAGVEIKVLRGIDHVEPADALFLHVDLTVVPEDYLSFSRQYPVVINGRVHDISKRRVSNNLLERHDQYEGPVIVKTDRNAGGLRELSRFNLLQRLSARAGWHLPWGWISYMRPDAYTVFQGCCEVPRAVWSNPNLVVEKYLTEREGEAYCIRQWVFFGDRESNLRIFSSSPIVKACNVISREQVPIVPEALRQMRKRLGFDYGKFDYAVRDGQVILYDANRTPALVFLDRTQKHSPLVAELAQALQTFSVEPDPAAGRTPGLA
jgi:hypothetical protein